MSVGLTAATSKRSAAAPAFGEATLFQLLPSQWTTKVVSAGAWLVPAKVAPTAQTLVAESATTELRSVFPSEGTMNTGAHAVPFQCSMKGASKPVDCPKPTAYRSLAVPSMPSRTPLPKPDVALVTTDQLVPFQC